MTDSTSLPTSHDVDLTAAIADLQEQVDRLTRTVDAQQRTLTRLAQHLPQT